VNALARDEVGNYLNAGFVSSFQKVGTFRIANGQKQGGNVASYFCTPDGRVLHAVAGPVKAAVLLREARWVVETYKLALLERPDDDTAVRAFVWNAHAERLRREHGLDLDLGPTQGSCGLGPAAVPRGKLNRQGQVHLLLAAAPLARLERVYKLVFENVLGETVSTAPVVVAGR
jgi:hypothetical protein